MSRSKKLQPIANIRKQQERDAARLHGDTLRQVGRQREQLNELVAYRDQYLKSFQLAAEAGLFAVQMQEYRIFINRLDVAIEQQQQSVTNDQKKCETSQEKWIDKRSRRKMIDKVVENRKLTEDKMKVKREQRELEDRPHNNIVNR